MHRVAIIQAVIIAIIFAAINHRSTKHTCKRCAYRAIIKLAHMHWRITHVFHVIAWRARIITAAYIMLLNFLALSCRIKSSSLLFMVIPHSVLRRIAPCVYTRAATYITSIESIESINSIKTNNDHISIASINQVPNPKVQSLAPAMADIAKHRAWIALVAEQRGGANLMTFAATFAGLVNNCINVNCEGFAIDASPAQLAAVEQLLLALIFFRMGDEKAICDTIRARKLAWEQALEYITASAKAARTSAHISATAAPQQRHSSATAAPQHTHQRAHAHARISRISASTSARAPAAPPRAPARAHQPPWQIPPPTPPSAPALPSSKPRWTSTPRRSRPPRPARSTVTATTAPTPASPRRRCFYRAAQSTPNVGCFYRAAQSTPNALRSFFTQ